MSFVAQACLLGLCLTQPSISAANEIGARVEAAPLGAFLNTSTSALRRHSLEFEQSPDAATITTGLKSYVTPSGERIDDVVFRDALGREAYFRGWNISGTTKLAESGFKPFRSVADARTGMTRVADMTAPNLIRFAIAWEGTNPAPDTIDYTYLDQVAAQMRVAISKRIYVLIDYHQDLFSRHLFNQGSWHTGNGAPAWVTPKPDYPEENCTPFPIFVCASWSQHNITDEAVRRASRNFWNNKEFVANNGKTYKLQDAFLSQFEESLRYLKTKFSPKEFAYILGVDPFNEPVDGGMDGLTPKEWDNQKLWPFYDRTREILNRTGWRQKWVYAEPLVFWNTNAGVVRATGGQLLDKKPGAGFVFNTHFYDASRQGPLNWAGVDNGTYFSEFDEIRKEARYRGNATLLSEFGAPLGRIGKEDTVRIIQSMYQGAEASDTIGGKTRYVDFYSNPISGTQWHWDYYYNNHRELMNANSSKLLAGEDAWNGENFSIAKNFSHDLTVDHRVVERAYPRKIQGDLMHFYFNSRAHDGWGKVLDWAGIRPQDNGPTWLKNSQFVLTTWRGRRSDAPTEIVLPRYWKAENLAVLTEKRRYSGNLVKDADLTQAANEVALVSDSISAEAARVLVWDDPDAGEAKESIHFALIVNQDNPPSTRLTPSQLEALRQDLIRALCRDKRGVVFLTGKMTHGGYP